MILDHSIILQDAIMVLYYDIITGYHNKILKYIVIGYCDSMILLRCMIRLLSVDHVPYARSSRYVIHKDAMCYYR